jgi:hypothetical protein
MGPPATTRSRVAALAGLACVAIAALGAALVPSAASAAPDGPAGGDSGLVPVPAGCTAPEPADLVFVGTVVGVDHLNQFVRYQIDQLRAGSASKWAVDGLIDVRYGDDYRFVDEGQQYLVGAAFDPEYGRLSSTVRPAAPLFGGNDVIGLDDASVDCPDLEQPVRTLHVDGTSVDSGVLSLLFDDRRLLAATVLVPTAIAFAALIALVLVRMLWGLAMKGVLELGRSAVTPTTDHRAVRVRAHHSPARDEEFTRRTG